MTDYTLSGPGGQSFKLTTPDDVSHEEVEQTLARTMTHQAEQPNPVPGTLRAGAKIAADFATGGLQRALDLPNSAIGELLQSDSANMAMGMTSPLKGGNLNFKTLLQEAGGERAKFDSIMEKIKNLPMKELNEVAKEYSLFPGNYKNKNDAISDMLKTFVRNARFENKVAASTGAGVLPRDYYETQMNTPKGYHWESGKLVEDGAHPGGKQEHENFAEQMDAFRLGYRGQAKPPQPHLHESWERGRLRSENDKAQREAKKHPPESLGPLALGAGDPLSK